MRSTDLIASTDEIPRHEAERLLSSVTGLSRSVVVLGVDITEEQAAAFDDAVQARSSGTPLQYIEGSVTFGPATLTVDDRVLIPRPETEYLLELVVGGVSAPDVIVDLCTGSGNLAIALAMTFPDARVLGTDVSEDALSVAEENARANDVSVELLHGHLFEPLPADIRGSVDLLTANPPYLAEGEFGPLPEDVKREPRGALVAGESGDELVASIGAAASVWLSDLGLVAVEVSEFHAHQVLQHFKNLDVSVVRDLSNRDRFVMNTALVD